MCYVIFALKHLISRSIGIAFILIVGGCAHEVSVIPEDYSILEGHKKGVIRSTGLGMHGSPAANAALENGKDEVRREICSGRKVNFFPIGAYDIDVTHATTQKIGDQYVTSANTSTQTVVRGFEFDCHDEIPYQEGTYFLDVEKLSCRRYVDGAVGQLRIEGLRKNPSTGQCSAYRGWLRTRTKAGDILEIFYGKDGL